MTPVRVRFAAVLAAGLCTLSGAGVAAAQGGSILLPPGTIISNGPREVMKIVQCGLDHEFLGYKECSVEIYRDGALLGGGLRRYPAEQMLKDLNDAREAKGLARLTADQASGRAPRPDAAGARPTVIAAPGTTTRPTMPPTQFVKTNPVAAVPQGPNGACPRTPYAEIVGTTPASVAMFRQVMESGHTFTRPAFLWTGVTFEAFSVGAPIRNTITMRPGVGPERVTDAAPVNAPLYPVRATYILCHQYASGPERTRIRTGNYCFVSRSGKWVCGTDSAVAKYEATPLG